ncbi:chorismate synthase [Gallibacter sp. Marseille-QA0791]|uniref:chorismate synthase n=1 Tax=Gallibacter sp. Marseille-QA0791 TaxID=3378781 RepID=UPI003D1134E2
MISTIGKNVRISIWGGSHEPAIGVDITGIPVGTEIDMDKLTAFLRRRAPGNSIFATRRKEPDIPLPLTGLEPCSIHRSDAVQSDTVSNGDPSGKRMIVTDNTISLEIRNTDTRSADYRALRTVPRPGHADYTARLRYGDSLNMAGGGPFSARMTAPLCIAGGIAMQILERQGITIGGHIYSVADARDEPFDPTAVNADLLNDLKTKDMAVISRSAKLEMQKRIWLAMEDRDSVGGVVEVCGLNIPAGIGGAMYDGLESTLAPLFFGIPAVKGVEFGAGFAATLLRGSQNNDAFYYEGDTVKTRTNNHGGILGGITTGMPLIARLAFKPTPSIAKEQASVDLYRKENTTLRVKGRHDPCVVMRAVPIAEAAMALGLLDCIMEVKR